MKITYYGNLILSDRVLNNGYITVEDGIITYIGEKKPVSGIIKDTKGYIAPGFVDIHCHDCPIEASYVDPIKVADYHYNRGTTSMLITFYRGQTHEKYLELIKKVKDAMEKTKNIRGIHFEGPYLNGKYGAQAREQDYPVKENYLQYLESGLFRQWTCSPEIDGTMELIREIKTHGCVPAIGHSEASYKQVEEAVMSGAGIVTHLFDATGTTPDGKTYAGTHDVSFNEACMLFDSLFYEVICDSEWIHVRKEMLKLLVKTVGIDKVVAITDCFFDPDVHDDLDVNLNNGELVGSKMTMDRVARNLVKAGYSMSDVSKMTSRNPARAIKLCDRGEIAVGKKAELILVDNEYNFLSYPD